MRSDQTQVILAGFWLRVLLHSTEHELITYDTEEAIWKRLLSTMLPTCSCSMYATYGDAGGLLHPSSQRWMNITALVDTLNMLMQQSVTDRHSLRLIDWGSSYEVEVLEDIIYFLLPSLARQESPPLFDRSSSQRWNLPHGGPDILRADSTFSTVLARLSSQAAKFYLLNWINKLDLS